MRGGKRDRVPVQVVEEGSERQEVTVEREVEVAERSVVRVEQVDAGQEFATLVGRVEEVLEHQMQMPTSKQD